MIFIYHLIAITLAIVIDKLIGDPKSLPHPVVWIGHLITFLEKRLNCGVRKKQKGILFLFLVIFIVFSLTIAFVSLMYKVHVVVGVLFEAFAISYTIAARSLKEAAMAVYKPLEENNLSESRLKLSYIVGRDTDQLQEADIVRGTVETVAENTSDGITAPLFFALIGGASLAFVYRAVNTCDSMVGYQNERFEQFGWASAKLDDVLNLIPSRLTGIIMIIVNRGENLFSKKECWQILFKDAPKHPSPNSGWLEAAAASLLGVQLGGLNYYQGIASFREPMGIAKQQLNKRHILIMNSMVQKTVYVFVILLWILGGIIYVIT